MPPDIASGAQQYCHWGPVTASVGATDDPDCRELALFPIRRAAPVTVTQRRRELWERLVDIPPRGHGGALGGVLGIPRIAHGPDPGQLSAQLLHARWFARWCTPRRGTCWKNTSAHRPALRSHRQRPSPPRGDGGTWLPEAIPVVPSETNIHVRSRRPAPAGSSRWSAEIPRP